MDLDTAAPADIDARLVHLHEEDRRLTELMKEEIRTPRPTAEDLVQAQAAINAIYAQLDEISDETSDIYGEFVRRGRWTRVWVEPGGRVHGATLCPDLGGQTAVLCPRDVAGEALSGAPVEEIARAAGRRACLRCFPDAPVDGPCVIRFASKG